MTRAVGAPLTYAHLIYNPPLTIARPRQTEHYSQGPLDGKADCVIYNLTQPACDIHQPNSPTFTRLHAPSTDQQIEQAFIEMPTDGPEVTHPVPEPLYNSA